MRPEPSEFAFHWGLNPETVFLNHGSFGATPLAIINEQRRWQDWMELEPVRFFEELLPPALVESRQALATMLSCDPDDLALVENATSGVNTILRSFDFKPGDEILVPDHAYQACRNAIDFVASRNDVNVVTVNIPFPIEGPQVVIDLLMESVTERTVLAMIDSVTSPTGLRMPFEELTQALEEKGVAVLLDAAHGIGMLPLSLADLGASFVTTNAHKWLCAPKGSAVLYVRKDKQEHIHPLTISHGMTFPLGETTRFRHEFDWTGTRDPTAWCVLPFVIEHLSSMYEGGWPAIMERNRSMVLEGRALLCDKLGVSTPCPDSMIATIATLILPNSGAAGIPLHDPDPLHSRLLERGIQIPVWSWPSPEGRYIRISAHLHNSREQYEYLAEVLIDELEKE
ncbi:MAG: aminotransferase [Euryarchaeota archaeon]|nr:aminotransferase [Euryarchaeota archaeon]